VAVQAEKTMIGPYPGNNLLVHVYCTGVCVLEGIYRLQALLERLACGVGEWVGE